MNGRFIAFEGGEATGKSTQASRLAERLGALCTHEPGDTVIGRAIRRIVLDPSTVGLADRTEALLMAADRAQHVAEVIRPALDSGRDVVTDRFAASSIAYQGHGRGLPVTEVEQLSRWATAGLWPDLIILLDVPVDESVRRIGEDLDRLETAGREFHLRVHAGFLAQAAADPARWAVVDGTGDPDEVAAAVWSAVLERWPDLGPR